MNINKVITYSLLAYIRNTGSIIEGPVDIFVPLVKRVLYLLSQNSIKKGNINEIKYQFDELYQIDIPLPVLITILKKIAGEPKEGSSSSGFQLYKDNSFWVEDYVFEEFEEQLLISKKEADIIQKFFTKFCVSRNIPKTDYASVFDFIDKNKSSLSTYLSGKPSSQKQDFTTEAQFIDFFKKIPSAFEFIKKIYLGSILSCYLEYIPEKIASKIELVLDTNFVVGLLDLNTPESTHTCMKLLEIGLAQGYVFSILIDTVEEIQSLLQSRAKYYSKAFIQARINPEDIYNACDRRKLSPVDLERISDNLESSLIEMKINIVPNTDKYKNIAKLSSEFSFLKTKRNSLRSALHDAIAIHYVRNKRGKRVYEFEKATCWLVHNSNTESSMEKSQDKKSKLPLPESIKCDELLNILWLSTPSISKNILTNDFLEIGINSLVAFTLNDDLPKASIIRELEDNIQKYTNEDLTDRDILLVSRRIVTKQLKNIHQLNELAKENSNKFTQTLREEALKQENLEKKQKNEIDSILSDLKNETQNLKKAVAELEVKRENNHSKLAEIEFLTQKLKSSEQNIIDLEKKIKEEKREKFIEDQFRKDRNKFRLAFWVGLISIFSLTFLPFYLANWNVEKAVVLMASKEGKILSITYGFLVIIFSVLSAIYILKFHNSSNIEAMKRGIKIPEELR